MHELVTPETTWKKRWLLSLLLCALAGLAALTACDPVIPSPPPITINITAVDDTTALAEGIREAIAATDQKNLDTTATIFAQDGITLTPSNTPTITQTPTATRTRFVTVTPTPTLTETSTATFAPFLTNTPGPQGDTSTAWLRIINAWRDVRQANGEVPLDVYINSQQMVRSLDVGKETTYFKVLSGVLRITLRNVDSDISGNDALPPLLSTVIEVPPGGVVSAVAVNQGSGLELVRVLEDPSPLPDGMARLTILQSNPVLLDSNVLLPNKGRALAYGLKLRDVEGPFDLPAGSFPVTLYNAEQPDQAIVTFRNPLQLADRVNYLLVMVPPKTASSLLTDTMLFSGVTRLVESDFSARFINISSVAVSISLGGKPQISNLGIGAISDAIPISRLGTRMTIQDSQGQIHFDNNIGPWNAPGEANTEKLFLMVDATLNGNAGIEPAVLPMDAPPSAINAEIRLIHGLPKTRPLTLQIRPIRTRLVTDAQGNSTVQQIGEDQLPWTTIGDVAQAGLASSYFGRIPEIYQVRAVFSGSSDPITSPLTLQLLAGGVYDFIVLPGTTPGSAKLEVIEPDVQVGGVGSSADNATAVFEGVNATLTALAPQITATPTRAVSPTATRTPIPTNTPRSTNTPSVLPPVVQIEPAPPKAATDTLVLTGQDFAPDKAFRVTLDNNPGVVLAGNINSDGTLTESTITLPSDIQPGAHTLRVCVDCVPRGVTQVQYAVFIVADPNTTATPTPAP